MKISKIVIAAILILIAVCVFITLFIGWGAFGFGQSLHDKNSRSLPENATLWEKNNADYCCISVFELVGPLELFSPTNSTISKVTFILAPIPGAPPIDMTNATFTLSTANTETTVRYGDPAVNVSWDGSMMNMTDDILVNHEQVHIELDTVKMGFNSLSFGRNQKFSLIATPPLGSKLVTRWATPGEFQPGVTMKIPEMS